MEETGELDDTIIIYTADQGFMLGEHDYIDKRWMAKDPHEMNNVIHDPDYASVAEEMKAKLLSEKRRIGDEDEKYPDLINAREKVWSSN